ncbi:RraA family protein [Microbacterium murale]|uniref:Putative 4-hydroxy-4-methyl-2-oxoglutarate aldolase n=1 Tax=Microbacterium murale TaxID=1081040 RepID=A0ABQ1RJ40_9MICO|nr:RraA family protein [Microbacterium murale]GGD69650.1 demethylmenaquinone methyltransferase [Microbacterium murale]
MTGWSSDAEMFALMRERLYTPVVGDILDELGFTHQFLPPAIRAMTPDMKLAGRAMTVLMIDVFGPQRTPFGRLTEALDQLETDEIYIAAGGTGRCAYWGELLTATARSRGATGAVVSGWHRDTPQVLEQGFPVFSRGAWAQDSSVRTQVVDFRCPIEIGQASVHSGDIVFGDVDGVVIIPQAVHVDVIARAMEKARTEKVVRSAVESGMSATEAFATYGVL